MERRHALGALAAIVVGVATWPRAAFAQATAQRKLVGFLVAGPADKSAGPRRTLLAEFEKLGWKEGENLKVEFRHGNHQSERIAALASELAAMNPALLLGATTEVVLALRKATDQVPIVAANFTNPVQHGLAASLARPGGNVTGVVTMGSDYFPKLIEFARIVAPQARRVSYLVNPANPNFKSLIGQPVLFRKLGAARGFEILPFWVRDAQEIEKAIRSMTPASDYVLLSTPDALIEEHLARIAELALAARLRSVSGMPTWSGVGGLLTYGPDLTENFKRAVQLADQILRGAKPADLPIEQPSRIPLVVNQRTAHAIGVKLPEALLVRADQIIE